MESGVDSMPPELRALLEIIHVKNNLKIAPDVAVSLLPRPGSCKGHKEIQNLSQRVCENLRHCPLFLSSSQKFPLAMVPISRPLPAKPLWLVWNQHLLGVAPNHFR